MTPSVARGSTWKCKSDFPLRSAAVKCRLSVGPEVQSGNSGYKIKRMQLGTHLSSHSFALPGKMNLHHILVHLLNVGSELR